MLHECKFPRLLRIEIVLEVYNIIVKGRFTVHVHEFHYADTGMKRKRSLLAFLKCVPHATVFSAGLKITLIFLF